MSFSKNEAQTHPLSIELGRVRFDTIPTDPHRLRRSLSLPVDVTILITDGRASSISYVDPSRRAFPRYIKTESSHWSRYNPANYADRLLDNVIGSGWVDLLDYDHDRDVRAALNERGINQGKLYDFHLVKGHINALVRAAWDGAQPVDRQLTWQNPERPISFAKLDTARRLYSEARKLAVTAAGLIPGEYTGNPARLALRFDPIKGYRMEIDNSHTPHGERGNLRLGSYMPGYSHRPDRSVLVVPNLSDREGLGIPA